MLQDVRSLVEDPEYEGDKLSTSRVPVIVWFAVVTAFAVAVGVVLLWTHVDCAGAVEAAEAAAGSPECRPVQYSAFQEYLDRMLDALWAFGAIYVGGKATGKLKGGRP